MRQKRKNPPDLHRAGHLAKQRSGRVLLGLDHFLATVETVGADVVAQVHFTSGGLNASTGRHERVVRTVHAALGRRFFILLDGHDVAPGSNSGLVKGHQLMQALVYSEGGMDTRFTECTECEASNYSIASPVWAIQCLFKFLRAAKGLGLGVESPVAPSPSSSGKSSNSDI
jgi:hypothetical protein